jgi:mono/diheme cytochrome c family protein
MILNLISLLILVAIVVFLGWLVTRAWKAKRWFVKWPGVILSGLLTLVFALVVVVAGIGLAKMYATTSEPAPNLKVEGTPEQIARGKYVAYIACAGCHGANGEFPLTGGFDLGTEN